MVRAVIGVPTAWIAGGTLVAGLGAGFWIGHEMGAARYLDGLHAGIKSQQKISDAEIARLQADGRADTAESVRQAVEAIADQQKARHDDEAKQRAQMAQEAADTARELDSLRKRLRHSARRPDSAGPGSVSAAPGPAAGPDDSADAERLLRETVGRLVDEAGASEYESSRYRGLADWQERVARQFNERQAGK